VSAVPRLTTPVAIVIAAAITCAAARSAGAQAPSPETGPEQALTQKIAVWRFDALGIEPELVARLETLFRMELDRLAKQPMPSRREVERAVTADQRECTGEEKCLGAIGKKLGVDVVVTGTVGALGDSYVLNIKAVEAATAKQLTRIQSDPLRGSPDDLIEGVRVAAYKLLAPDQLHGTVQIQSDLVGAEVKLDDKTIGKTPLPQLGVVGKLALGKHKLRVQAQGYAPFEEDVEIRFQKVSQVVVRLLPSDQVIGTGKVATVERKPFYTKTWFIIGVGVAAAAIGAYAGWRAGTIDCVRIVNGRPDQAGC
jgi:hypothetical protein